MCILWGRICSNLLSIKKIVLKFLLEFESFLCIWRQFVHLTRGPFLHIAESCSGTHDALSMHRLMPKLLYFFLKYFSFASGVMFLQGPMLSFHDVDFSTWWSLVFSPVFEKAPGKLGRNLYPRRPCLSGPWCDMRQKGTSSYPSGSPRTQCGECFFLECQLWFSSNSSFLLMRGPGSHCVFPRSGCVHSFWVFCAVGGVLEWRGVLLSALTKSSCFHLGVSGTSLFRQPWH